MAIERSKVEPSAVFIKLQEAKGDLGKLNDKERAQYYVEFCESVGLNPLTCPLDYIQFQGRMTLYAKKAATDQLRDIYEVSIYKIETNIQNELMEVLTYARNKNGREDIDLGCVSLAGLKGEALGNAKMKAITKAKRRVTLSICGLGMLDETEVETIPGAQFPVVDKETGEVKPRFRQPVSLSVDPETPGLANVKMATNGTKKKASREDILNKIQDHFDSEPFEAPKHEEAWVFKYAGIEGDWRQAEGAELMTLAACVKARHEARPIEPCQKWREKYPEKAAEYDKQQDAVEFLIDEFGGAEVL